MKEQLEALFEQWLNPKTRNVELLNKLYSEIKGTKLDDCPKCKAKAITELRKYYDANYNWQPVNPERQYLLKPGNHQFLPGEKPVHNNENTGDAILKWYLQHYPHIKPLFIKLPE